MKKIKEKILEITNYKYFVPIFVISINLLFFIVCNLIFELRYETVDDFTIMKIISALDGNYSIYGVYIHPAICFIIMMLFKTGININWYTVFLLVVQFVSFSTIGIVLVKKNKKIGTLLYLVVLSVYYSRLLVILNYTTISTTAILAGITVLMQYKQRKYKIFGYILIAIGIMLRTQTIALVIPFYVLYALYKLIKNKEIQYIKSLFTIIIIFISIYISNIVIYNIKPINKEYSQFNKIRTFFFDSNIIDYEKDKEVLDKNGWTFSDWMIFYSYSLADENFYTTENLTKLKDSLNIENQYVNKITNACKKIVTNTFQFYMLFFVSIIILVLLSVLFQKKRKIILLYFFTFIVLYFVLNYTKTVFRVVIPMYMSAFVIISMALTENETERIKNKKNKYILSICIICFFIILNSIYSFRQLKEYHKNDFGIIKNVIDYTSENKNNIYVYPNVLQNISFAYSVYEKIDDKKFENLRHMGEWDIYHEEYYKFKQKYNIENIMTDLYKRNDVYLIDGDVSAANNVIYTNHVEGIRSYIKQHYNVEVKCKVIKEFKPYSIKIYKLYEEEQDEENFSSNTYVF